MDKNIEKLIKRNLGNLPTNSLVSRTIFSVIFPRYLEKYIREFWEIIYRILKSYFINSILDISKGLIKISTSNFTKDPFIIIKARAFLLLITRSVPVQQAAKIFEDEIYSDIIKISSFTRNRKIFLKRRKRLVGINGSTIKAIEMVTQTYLLVQGNTVSCMGTHSGLKQTRKIIEDCMKNIHPIFHVKILMIKQELGKDPTLLKKSWNNYLPLLKKKNTIEDIKPQSFCGKNKKTKIKKSIYKNSNIIHESPSMAVENSKKTLKFENFFKKNQNFAKSLPYLS